LVVPFRCVQHPRLLSGVLVVAVVMKVRMLACVVVVRAMNVALLSIRKRSKSGCLTSTIGSFVKRLLP
jgi:hypothetical protein